VKESTLKDKLDQMEYTFDKKRAQKCRCLLAARVKWGKGCDTHTESFQAAGRALGATSAFAMAKRTRKPNPQRTTLKRVDSNFINNFFAPQNRFAA
jgi:hypothetical protein